MTSKTPPIPTPSPSPPAEDELLKLRTELATFKDVAGCAQADLLNAKDRLERERQDIGKFALAGAMTRLLPTLDNLQRAFTHLPEELKNHEWMKGIVAIESELMRTAGDLGLARMQSLGLPVDTNLHEVLQTGPGEADKVIEVFEEGYTFNGRVLRPAKVRVGSGDLEGKAGKGGQESKEGTVTERTAK